MVFLRWANCSPGKDVSPFSKSLMKSRIKSWSFGSHLLILHKACMSLQLKKLYCKSQLNETGTFIKKSKWIELIFFFLKREKILLDTRKFPLFLRPFNCLKHQLVGWWKQFWYQIWMDEWVRNWLIKQFSLN